jgi:ATP-binding cassette subfamily B protein/subfamily B ATP-binding cassette protein MsbA
MATHRKAPQRRTPRPAEVRPTSTAGTVGVVSSGPLAAVGPVGPRKPVGPASAAVGSETTTLLPVQPMSGPDVQAAPTVTVRSIFREFWPDTRTFRGRLILSLLMVALPPLLAAVGIYLFKVLVDDVLTPRNLQLFPLVAAAFVAVTVVEGVVSFVDEYLNAWVAERFVLILRSRVFDHLQRLSLTFFEKNQKGDILARLTGDVTAIEGLMLSGLNQALTYVFQIIFFAGALFFLDWRLAAVALIAAPGFLLLARFFSTRIKNASRERRRRSGSISAVAEESLHNVALVQAYNQEEHESARFHRENVGSFTAQMLATKLEALFAPFTDLLQALGVLLVIGVGIHELIAGRLSLGGLLIFLGYLTQLYGPISGFGQLINSIYSASAGAERIIEVLRTEPEVTDPADPVPLGRARGELRVEQLGFHYPGTSRPTLAGIGFSAAPGETVAVVGASGAGKSTLMRLLLRLHDPAVGEVTLDGVDIRRLSLADLRTNVAVVLQETLVFDGTVAENIRWGRPEATPADVVQAARDADAHQFITSLPEGYHTRIGQRGMMLSGGQRQRVALARAIIRNAPVLLLDEPTTGLDAVSTQRVMAPLRRAMCGRTTIVISHNLLTVTDANRIVYLERGRLAGYGTHAELMARSPGYAELYRSHHPEPTPALRAHPVRPRPQPTAAAVPARGAVPAAPQGAVPAAAQVPVPAAAQVPVPVPIAGPVPGPRPAGEPSPAGRRSPVGRQSPVGRPSPAGGSRPADGPSPARRRAAAGPGAPRPDGEQPRAGVVRHVAATVARGSGQDARPPAPRPAPASRAPASRPTPGQVPGPERSPAARDAVGHSGGRPRTGEHPVPPTPRSGEHRGSTGQPGTGEHLTPRPRARTGEHPVPPPRPGTGEHVVPSARHVTGEHPVPGPRTGEHVVPGPWQSPESRPAAPTAADDHPLNPSRDSVELTVPTPVPPKAPRRGTGEHESSATRPTAPAPPAPLAGPTTLTAPTPPAPATGSRPRPRPNGRVPAGARAGAVPGHPRPATRSRIAPMPISQEPRPAPLPLPARTIAPVPLPRRQPVPPVSAPRPVPPPAATADGWPVEDPDHGPAQRD